MAKPVVTVLMPVYNGEKYLQGAIDSILNQTFSDFEFLIIDDGSTDRSVEIINSYNDPRIRLFKNGTNLKLISTLNKGLELAQGQFIARMDCDDISLLGRLAKQVQFLNDNPDVGLCGTWAKTIGVYDGTIYQYPTNFEIVKCWLLFQCSLLHPTIMMRRELFTEHNLKYSKEYLHAEDYAFFVAASKITRLANLPEVLLYYRFSENQVSSQYFATQKETNFKIQTEQLINLGIQIRAKEARLHKLVTSELDPACKKEAFWWLVQMIKSNAKKYIYDQSALFLTIRQYWKRIRNFFDIYETYICLCHELSSCNKKFAIWGCGDFARALAKSDVLSKKVCCVVDGNPVNIGKPFKELNLVIEPPSILCHKTVDVIIAASWQRSVEIAHDIRHKYGISSDIVCADGIL